MKITVQLPEGVQRVETGPLQINDDWAGIFLRGDDCFGHAINLDIAIRFMEANHPKEWLLLGGLKALQNMLFSSTERTNRPTDQIAKGGQ